MPTAVPTATVPAVTDTPEPTVNPDLTSDKVEGVWLVGKEVAVGLWRANGDCYAVTKDKSGSRWIWQVVQIHHQHTFERLFGWSLSVIQTTVLGHIWGSSVVLRPNELWINGLTTK